MGLQEGAEVHPQEGEEAGVVLLQVGEGVGAVLLLEEEEEAEEEVVH